MGGVLYHNSLGHHPASGVGPGMFVFLAFAVECMRAPIWMAFGGLMVCYVFAVGLAKVLVKPKAASDAANKTAAATAAKSAAKTAVKAAADTATTSIKPTTGKH